MKVGYTTRDVQKRVADQYPVKLPGDQLPYKIVYQDSAVREDGTAFTDIMVHWWLRKNGFANTGGEWFRCIVGDVRAAMYALKSGTENDEHRTETFSMRDEQREAVSKTAAYFRNYKRETGKNLTIFGTARCASARPSPPISWPGRCSGSASSC